MLCCYHFPRPFQRYGLRSCPFPRGPSPHQARDAVRFPWLVLAFPRLVLTFPWLVLTFHP